MGETGEDGGEERWVVARANRAFLTVAGGVVLNWGRGLGERSPFNEEYGLLCAVLLLERRGE